VAILRIRAAPDAGVAQSPQGMGMFLAPFLAAAAFLAPPAAFGVTHVDGVAHAVRPVHAAPVVALRPVRLRAWWAPAWVPPVSRAAARVA
jgi:hypothetical protein